METKTCESCLEQCLKSDIVKNKQICKKCSKKIRHKKWKEKNKNSEKYKKNRKQILEKYAANNKQKLKQANHEYYLKNKDDPTSAFNEWRKNNKEKISSYKKKWRENNKEKISEYSKIYSRIKSKNPSYSISRAMSHGIWSALQVKKSSKKGCSWEKIVGYTRNDLKVHLESKFTTEMTWENYGSYWHIDHIIPKSWFEYSSFEDDNFKKCWSLSNLQPLPAKENLSKSNRWAG